MNKNLNTPAEEHNLLCAPSIYKPFKYPWAYDAWHIQQKIHWLPEEVPLSDDVKDWKCRLTTNEKNLLTQIFRFFTQSDIEVNNCYMKHYARIFKPTEILMMLAAFSNIECFSADTEILTTKGWVEFPKLTLDDLVAQYDSVTEELSFVKPQKLVAYDFKGDLKYFNNQNTDILVTTNHDMLIRLAGARGKKRGFAKYKAEDCININHRGRVYPTSGFVRNLSKDFTDTERLLIMMHNNVQASDGTSFTINIFDDSKKANLIEVLNNLGFKYLENDLEFSTSYIFDIKSLDVTLEQVRNFSWVEISKISTDWSKEFINYLNNWACSTKNSNIHYLNKILEAIEIVQIVASIAGYGTGIRSNNAKNLAFERFPTAKNHFYILIISTRNCRNIPKPTDVFYDDKVYCVSVPTENIMVRRNGKMAITGNTIHIDAYSKLLDTIGMPEIEYQAFLNYKEMKDKYEYMHSFNVDNKFNIALTLAGFGAFTEGLQLFASFAILLNFQRFGKMKGMCQIIAWSVRDETLHTDSIIKLFHTFLQENPEIHTKELENKIVQTCRDIIHMEDEFIKLAFDGHDLEGLTEIDVKNYIRYIGDRRLNQLGYKEIFNVAANPLPWLDEMLNGVEFANFFENRVTEYSKSATAGTWDDAFEN